MSARERHVGITVLAVIGGLGLLLAVIGAVAIGFAGFLVFIGLTLLLLGIGAVVIGRPGWALIGSRKLGAGVLAIGLVLVVGGGAITPALPAECAKPSRKLGPPNN